MLPIRILIQPAETDKAALSIAINNAESVTQEQLDKVVPAVVNEFKAALENAKTVYDNDSASQEEIDNATSRLIRVMHMLEFYKGDKTALSIAILMMLQSSLLYLIHLPY